MKVSFEGTTYKKNNRSGSALKDLCFEIFKKYLKDNNNLTIDSVKNIFNRVHCSNNKVVIAEKEWEELSDDGKSRYFDPVSYDGDRLYFTTQWGNNGGECDNINSMIKFAKEQGYDIDVLETGEALMNNYESEFKSWWFNDGSRKSNGECYATNTKSSYFRELQKLKNKLGYSVFEIDDVSVLNNILYRLQNGDLKEYNYRLQNSDPSSGLIQYIKFIETKIKNNNYNIKNIVLYGVPGVGKTHNVNKLIRLIEDGKTADEIFFAIRHNDQSNEGLSKELKDRTEFVTFHQSFGYEDFIEGFRPDEDGNIRLVDGVFKKLAQKAEKNLLESMKERSFDIDTFLQDYSTYIEENDHTELEPGLTVKVKRNSEGEVQSFIVGGRIIDQSLTKSVITRDFENFLNGKIKSYMDIKPSYNSKSKYHGNASNYFKLYQDMKRFMDRIGIEKYFSKSEPLQNYYLVIDEINRGNISKIFGELITLIEEDKRDILEVTLPYSNLQEPFRVPSNLYIIGTMNSTDKSIALIDVALRRRFTFVKMDPNADLIDDPNAKNLFIALNEYLRERLGEDYQIGHSYFMKVRNDGDLNFVIEYKIKPLLEEYFYGDNEGLNGALKILKAVGSEGSANDG